MAMKGKMRSKGGCRRRIRSKREGSDASDDDYQIEDDGEFQDSDEYCSSLAGDELEDDLVVDEKKEKVRMTSRLKRRNTFPSKTRVQVGKASKQRKVSYKEDSDDDYVDDDDDDDDVDMEEAYKDWGTGFPKRKRNGAQKVVNKKKVSCTEENDDEETEHNDDDYEAADNGDDCNEKEDDEDSHVSLPSMKQNGIRKAVKKKKSAYMEENDDDYEVEDNTDDDDEDYNYNEDEFDLPNGCSNRKQNEVQKSLKKKKASYQEENDDDYEAEDDECDGDEDYNDNRDEEDLRNSYQRRKQNGVQKTLKKKNTSYTEGEDEDYEAEDDECDDDDDYNHNTDDKDLWNTCPSRKQNGVQKALKKKKALCMEDNDDDYEAEDDDFEDDDDYDNEEEDDEDFTPNEIDFDDEDEFVDLKKHKKLRGTPLQGSCLSRGRKRRNSRVTSKTKKKKPAKRHGFDSKSSSGHRKEATKGKLTMKEANERNSGRKRRRLVVDSDSDFADSEQLLLGQEYTISEEEREQVREASKFCGRLDVALRKPSSKKRSQEEENLQQERKHKMRNGKDKVEDLTKEAAKQVCGICFSEEGKRTVRGTLDSCSHYFCFNCIMEWSKVESRCPLCKQRFATISKPARTDIVCDLRTVVVPVPERDQVYQPSEEELRAYIDPYENVNCTECHHGGDDANMLLCDLCDSPAHTYCVGLSEVPEGNWYCEGCRPTALGPSSTQASNFTCDRRTTNDLSTRSFPSENVRESIDLNRVYEPETPLPEGSGMSSSPRPVDGDLRAGSSIPGAGVQTLSERRRRHQQIAQFAGRTGVRLGPEVEWTRTVRLGSQNAARSETSTFQNTFSSGLLHDNFASPVPTLHLLPATPNHLRASRVWGRTLTGVNGSSGASGSLHAGFAGNAGGDAWFFHGHSRMR